MASGRKLDRTENTIILVDQVRAALGQMVFRQGKQEQAPPQPPQIRFLKHNASVNIAFSQGKKLYMMDDGSLTDKYDKASNDFKSLGADGKEVAGLEMRCKVEKNSTGVPFRNASMRFCFPVFDIQTGEMIQDVGFDLSYELLIAAEHYRIVESGGGGMYYPLDDKFKRIRRSRWPGRPRMEGRACGAGSARQRRRDAGAHPQPPGDGPMTTRKTNPWSTARTKTRLRRHLGADRRQTPNAFAARRSGGRLELV